MSDHVQTLDRVLQALTDLRGRAAAGNLDDAVLDAFVRGVLVAQVLDHPLVKDTGSADIPPAAEADGARAGAYPGPADEATDGQPAPPAPGQERLPTTAAAAETSPPAAPTESAPAAAQASAEQPAEQPAGTDAEQAEPEPPSPHQQAEQLVAHLPELAERLRELGLRLPPKPSEFLSRAGAVLPRLPQDESRGDLLAQLLFEAVRMLDQVEQSSVFSRHRTQLAALLADRRVELTEVLSGTYGFHLTPGAELGPVTGSPPEGVEVSTRITPDPDGTVLAVLSRTLERDGKRSGAAKVLVSQGKPDEYRAFMIELWRAIEADGSGDALGDMDRIVRWLDELDDGDDTARITTARHVLNMVHDRNRDGRYDKIERWLLGFLGKAGIKELPVKVGKRFDDSYSPGKYDRHLEFVAGTPEGIITRVVRIGLVDKDGLPLQKAVLGVSKGG